MNELKKLKALRPFLNMKAVAKFAKISNNTLHSKIAERRKNSLTDEQSAKINEYLNMIVGIIKEPENARTN